MEVSNFRETILTNRGLADYIDALEIPEEEFDRSDTLILDLGARIQQRLAKDIRHSVLKSKIVSLDPRLGLSREEDMTLPSTERDLRTEGRDNSEPRSLAAVSEALPFKDGVFEHVYALFSVPYYLSHSEEVTKTLNEVVRVLRPGGIFRAYPVLPEQITMIQDILGKTSSVEFSMKQKKDDYILVVTKKP